MFISPTEPRALHDIGVVSNFPEDYGADIAWYGEKGLVGVQRKEFPGDFIASVRDGRLSKQVSQLQDCDKAVLILEGQVHWATDGHLFGSRTDWSKTSHTNLLMSIQAKGVMVCWSTGVADTIRVVKGLRDYFDKDEHLSLEYRPHAPQPAFTTLDNRHYQSYLLQGLPYTGPKTADSILNHCGFPLRWGVGWEKLAEVHGIGPKYVEVIRGLFEETKGGST